MILFRYKTDQDKFWKKKVANRFEEVEQFCKSKNAIYEIEKFTATGKAEKEKLKNLGRMI